jgi:hypothetical protein
VNTNIRTWSSLPIGVICVISGFHHEVAESCALLGYYVASSGDFLTPEGGLS